MKRVVLMDRDMSLFRHCIYPDGPGASGHTISEIDTI